MSRNIVELEDTLVLYDLREWRVGFALAGHAPGLDVTKVSVHAHGAANAFVVQELVHQITEGGEVHRRL